MHLYDSDNNHHTITRRAIKNSLPIGVKDIKDDFMDYVIIDGKLKNINFLNLKFNLT